MCFDICTINIRVSIRVRGLHLVFPRAILGMVQETNKLEQFPIFLFCLVEHLKTIHSLHFPDISLGFPWLSNWMHRRVLLQATCS